MNTLILASASPRRRELLQQIGVPCEVMPVDLCEDVRADEAPHDYVERLAREKAQAGFQRALEAGQAESVAVLGSDTSVILDGEILGKPRDAADAVAMLLRLSGRTHEVMTGVAVADAQRCLSQVVTTTVTFVAFDEACAQAYWTSGEPADKAGAYGIQGLGAVLVAGIDGSYSAVVGLPLAETAMLLKEFDIPVWQRESGRCRPVSGAG